MGAARESCGHPSWRRCDFKTQFLGAVRTCSSGSRQARLSRSRTGGALPASALDRAYRRRGAECGRVEPVTVAMSSMPRRCSTMKRRLPIRSGATGSRTRERRCAMRGSRSARRYHGSSWDQATGIYTTAAPHNLVVARSCGRSRAARLRGHRASTTRGRLRGRGPEPDDVQGIRDAGGPVQAIPSRGGNGNEMFRGALWLR
jgi:hypothetical protein